MLGGNYPQGNASRLPTMNTNTRRWRSHVLVLLVAPFVLLADLVVLPFVLVRLAVRGHAADCPCREGRGCSCFLSSWRAVGRGLRNGWREAFASALRSGSYGRGTSSSE